MKKLCCWTTRTTTGESEKKMHKKNRCTKKSKGVQYRFNTIGLVAEQQSSILPHTVHWSLLSTRLKKRLRSKELLAFLGRNPRTCPTKTTHHKTSRIPGILCWNSRLEFRGWTLCYRMTPSKTTSSCWNSGPSRTWIIDSGCFSPKSQRQSRLLEGDLWNCEVGPQLKLLIL